MIVPMAVPVIMVVIVVLVMVVVVMVMARPGRDVGVGVVRLGGHGTVLALVVRQSGDSINTFAAAKM